MIIRDDGHKYKLLSLDGEPHQELTFVKRMGTKFPGNLTKYPGTILQDVLRCCLDRVRYLQRQQWCGENVVILACLKFALWLLEFRAARRHKYVYLHSFWYAEYATPCRRCGHTFCYLTHERTEENGPSTNPQDRQGPTIVYRTR